VIRNVVVGRLNDGVEHAQLEPLLAEIAALDLPGTLACRLGTDLGLRDGSWDFAITSDFVDEAAYRAYDLDEEHNRIRRDIAQLAAEVVRVQFQA
jgi:hypothetical protein